MVDQYRSNAPDQEQRKFDFYVPAVTVISEEHRLVHDGMVFYQNIFEAAVPDNNSRVALMRTGDKPVHLKRISVTASEGPVNISLNENAVVNVLGTQVPILNLNRVSTRTPETEWYDNTTTFTDTGNPLLGNLYIPATGNNGVAGETGAIEEFVLKPNTDYRWELENDPAGSGTADISFTVVFYEIDYEAGSG